MKKRIVLNAKQKAYPNIGYLVNEEGYATGVRFYMDESYLDFIKGKLDAEDCCTCDDLHGPASYMTCPDAEEDTVLYVCEKCIREYDLEMFVDRAVPGAQGIVY